MDSFDSYRSSVPARLPASRSGSPSLRASSGLPEAASQSPLSIQVVFRGARRYWWLVLMLWIVLSAGIGAGIYLKVKPTYLAYSVLRAEPASTDLYGVNTRSETFDMFLQTQVKLITSPNVLTGAGTNSKAASLKLVRGAGDVVQELKKVVNVNVSPGTYLIEVSMTSQDPYEAQVIVNAVVDSFINTNEEWADGMTRNQIKNLNEYIRELENQTDELERRWKELVAKGDVEVRQLALDKKASENAGGNANETESAGNRSVTLEQYKTVQNQLLTIDLELAEAQAVLATAKAAAGKASRSASPSEDKVRLDKMIERKFQTDPEVMSLASQMLDAQEKAEKTRRLAVNPSDPSVRATQKKVDGLKEKYNGLWESKSTAWREEFESGGPNAMSPEQEVRELQGKVESLEARRVALKKTAADLKVNNQKEATDSVEVQLIMDRRSSIKQMKEAVQRRLEQLKYESRGETRVRLVSAAMLPNKPQSDKRYTFLAATPIGVLVTVLGLVVLLEIRAGRVADPEVLSSRLKHEVFSIAPLPNLKPGEDVNGEKAEQRLARFVQSLDHLRVAICEGGVPGGEGRCVMITSATGGEGKTTLSAHLAARCANSGTSTLLIDADMRRASLGRLLDVPVGAGLGDVLGGDIDLDDALITVQAGGFHFLSAGTPGRDPSRVLKSARLSELIARLRQTYDLVIIDTPPVLPVADALIMGRWADGAVMAARFDASRLPLVERANRQLALAGIPVLGVVVNGVRGQDAAYGNYAYSYNYYPSRAENNPTA